MNSILLMLVLFFPALSHGNTESDCDVSRILGTVQRIEWPSLSVSLKWKTAQTLLLDRKGPFFRAPSDAGLSVEMIRRTLLAVDLSKKKEMARLLGHKAPFSDEEIAQFYGYLTLNGSLETAYLDILFYLEEQASRTVKPFVISKSLLRQAIREDGKRWQQLIRETGFESNPLAVVLDAALAVMFSDPTFAHPVEMEIDRSPYRIQIHGDRLHIQRSPTP